MILFPAGSPAKVQTSKRGVDQVGDVGSTRAEKPRVEHEHGKAARSWPDELRLLVIVRLCVWTDFACSGERHVYDVDGSPKVIERPLAAPNLWSGSACESVGNLRSRPK